MGLDGRILKLLFVAPEVNPNNKKAKSIPIFNPIDPYGRVFFFSWLGFMVAFLSWYAFPPLLTVTIKKDLHMSEEDVANSNIIALLATLLVRFFCGALCDRFGPRLVFVGLLLTGAIPTALAGLVTNPKGLIALRFFIGILGGTFVPCQVWSTGFFDKDIVGTANALTGGFGNSGGGITYFVMPAIYNSLVRSQGLTPHKAWRVAYVIPFIIITAIALTMLFTCPDTPTGKWSERNVWIKNQVSDVNVTSEDIIDSPSTPGENTPTDTDTDLEKKGHLTNTNNNNNNNNDNDNDNDNSDTNTYTREESIIITPSFTQTIRIIFSLSTMSVALPYACSFGSELSINNILSSYYAHKFPTLGQTQAGSWAAMFGLLNIVFRPLGGFVSDLLYRVSGTVWSKKAWLVFLGVVMGAFEMAIGFSDSKIHGRQQGTLFGLMAGLAFLAFFLEGANGANFALVPHAHPCANGVVSGTVGGMGNLGGIIFAIIFRYNGSNYGQSMWIIGVICIAVNLVLCWTRPVSRLGV